MSEQQFWAVMTSKRDEGLAHITELVERSGLDQFCNFLTKHILPNTQEDSDITAHIIAHMAIIGAVDALLAWKEAKENA